MSPLTIIAWIMVIFAAIALFGIGDLHDDDNPNGPYDGDGW